MGKGYTFGLFLNVVILMLTVKGDNDVCPTPSVRKTTIIRSHDSVKNGAVLLLKEKVEKSRHCYELCCAEKTCNVALMHYKPDFDVDGEATVEKHCYLFNCGSPSVCTFEEHSHYAVIHVDRTIDDKRTTEAPTKAPTTENKPTTEGISEGEEEKCPPGVPVAMCSDDPCTLTKCSLKNVVCKANFCGGCNAHFYNQQRQRVDCSASEKTFAPDREETSNPNEEAVTVSETDYQETPLDTLAGIIPKKPTTDTPEDNNKDPYFNTERRKWLPDGGEEEGVPSVLPSEGTGSTVEPTIVEVKVVSSLRSIPLLVALVICIVLMMGLIYRFKCANRGKPKKFPVDDGDYLINGMYL